MMAIQRLATLLVLASGEEAGCDVSQAAKGNSLLQARAGVQKVNLVDVEEKTAEPQLFERKLTGKARAEAVAKAKAEAKAKEEAEKAAKAKQPPGVMEPPLDGVFTSPNGRPHLIMAQDIDWPPYAYMSVPPESDFDVAGLGHDVIKAMGELCGFDVTVVQTDWRNCWNNGQIGSSLLNGVFHGCMTYTHTVGMRNRFVEFSDAILQMNKPAGIVTRLDGNGDPVINGNHNLAGIRVVDVTGWAPTPDTLAVGVNDCTGESFADFDMLEPVPCPTDGSAGSTPNDCALNALLDGRAEAMWLYADQGYNYRPDQEGVTPEWDVDLWARMGQPNGFAYIHTGMLEHTYNGTTIAMSKKGSGVAEFLNPCIAQFVQTEQYNEITHKHHVDMSAFRNEFTQTEAPTTKAYEMSTPQLTTSCADGYCPCPSL